MDASQLIHHIPEWVNTYASAAGPIVQAELTKQGAKFLFGGILDWAKSQFGEKGSVTKSFMRVEANPDDKQARDRLIQDLKEDANPQQLQELQSLVEELKPYINVGIQIDGDNNLAIAGNLHAPMVKDTVLKPYSAIIQGDGNTVQFSGDVKKNL